MTVELLAEIVGLKAEIERLTLEREEARAGLVRALKALDAARAETLQREREREMAVAERQEAWAEHDEMQLQRDGARQEADHLAAEAAELQQALGTVRLERDLITFDRESLASERDSARLEREAAREEREAARLEREAVRAEAESLRARAIAMRCLGCGGWVLVDPGGSIPAYCQACGFDQWQAEREHAQEQSHWYEASLA